MSSVFSRKVASLRQNMSARVDALLPVNDPTGVNAHAFVDGMYRSLIKEAGLSQGQACGFLYSLAELGWSENNQKQAWGTPTVDRNAGFFGNAGHYLHALGEGIAHPATAVQAINGATSSPTMSAVTDHAYNKDYMGVAGDVGGALWDKVKSYIPKSWGEAGDTIGKQFTPENMKAWAPHVVAGLGTFAAGKLMGLGTGASALAGVAGGYGLPKMYDEFSKLKPTAPAAAPATAPTTAPAVAPTAPARTDQAAKLDVSAGSAASIAQQAAQVGQPLWQQGQGALMTH